MIKKYKSLLYKGSTITERYLIEEILVKEGLSWIIRCEFENANLEIQNKTIIFNGGVWYNGIWVFGAWRAGEWRYGKWVDGVWFNGTWYDGVFENGIIFNGTFLQGNFLSGKLRKKNQNGTPTKHDFVDCEISPAIKEL